jgi:hypothetical protein
MWTRRKRRRKGRGRKWRRGGGSGSSGGGGERERPGRGREEGEGDEGGGGSGEEIEEEIEIEEGRIEEKRKGERMKKMMKESYVASVLITFNDWPQVGTSFFLFFSIFIYVIYFIYLFIYFSFSSSSSLFLFFSHSLSLFLSISIRFIPGYLSIDVHSSNSPPSNILYKTKESFEMERAEADELGGSGRGRQVRMETAENVGQHQVYRPLL